MEIERPRKEPFYKCFIKYYLQDDGRNLLGIPPVVAVEQAQTTWPLAPLVPVRISFLPSIAPSLKPRAVAVITPTEVLV